MRRLLKLALSCGPNRLTPRMAALIPVAVLALRTASAQDPQPVLPNLAPREVEIRGQLVIQFPALERQPLIGFNPPPRIPTIPADRRPLVEEYKQNRECHSILPLGAERPNRGLLNQRQEH